MRSALINKGIDLDSALCPRCGEETEDIDHTLVGCIEAKRVWELIGGDGTNIWRGLDPYRNFFKKIRKF